MLAIEAKYPDGHSFINLTFDDDKRDWAEQALINGPKYSRSLSFKLIENYTGPIDYLFHNFKVDLWMIQSLSM